MGVASRAAITDVDMRATLRAFPLPCMARKLRQLPSQKRHKLLCSRCSRQTHSLPAEAFDHPVHLRDLRQATARHSDAGQLLQDS